MVSDAPFPGLRPFGSEDPPTFFGRADVIRRLVERVRSHRLLILFGPSGVGKTSLVAAGLTPALLASQQAPNLVLRIRVREDPYNELASSLIALPGRAEAAGDTASAQASLAARLRESPVEFAHAFCEWLPADRTLLVVDQYEECFTVPLIADRTHFECAFSRATMDVGLRVLLVIRSDYLGLAIANGPLADLGSGSLFALEPLTAAEAREAIVAPAALQGVELESPLVDRIISDLGDERHPALLQLVMYQLWSATVATGATRITLSAYERLGAQALQNPSYKELEQRSRWSLARLASRSGFAGLGQRLEARAHEAEQVAADMERLEQELSALKAQRAALGDRLRAIRVDDDVSVPRVFVSYASEDRKRVKELYAHLKAQGFRPWIDCEDIPAGKEWAHEIGDAMRHSDFVIVCLSATSTTKRGFVQRELKDALKLYDEIPEGTTFLLPVRLDDCPVPDSLTKFQYTDLFGEGGLERLTRSILTEWAGRVAHPGADGA